MADISPDIGWPRPSLVPIIIPLNNSKSAHTEESGRQRAGPTATGAPIRHKRPAGWAPVSLRFGSSLSARLN